jgi:solute carrier family 50 (sugar transporter)
MFFNCLGWVTYAVLINNLFVFFGNIFALILSVWLNMIALELQYADHQSTEIRRSICRALTNSGQEAVNKEKDPETPLDYAKIVWDVAALNTKAPVAHKTIILFLTVIWTALLSIISLGKALSPVTKELIIGVAVNVNLVFFYAAPLSTIFTVLKTRSCASIHASTVYTMFANGLFWGIFGFAVVDWFIAIPNTLGALLGALQIVLCVIFPRIETISEDAAVANVENGHAEDVSLKSHEIVEQAKALVEVNGGNSGPSEVRSHVVEPKDAYAE